MEIASSTGAQSQVDLEGSNGEMTRGGGEQLLVEGSGLWWRAEITGGGPTGGEQLLVEGSGLRWRGAVADGGPGRE